jgi:ribosome-binding factor A
MSSRRVAKVAEAVREQVSTSILFDLKDPRVKHVTVTRVEASPDLRSAKVYISVMGDETAQRLTLRGLESARGFLQAKLAERVQLRYTPILRFQLDDGVKRSIEASRLLREVLPPSSLDSLSSIEEPSSVEEEFGDEEEEFSDSPASEEHLSSEERPLFEEHSAGPVGPALPISKTPYERPTENHDG